jgi:hypothetical protein
MKRNPLVKNDFIIAVPSIKAPCTPNPPTGTSRIYFRLENTSTCHCHIIK